MTRRLVYRVNRAQIIFEKIEGELLLINLQKGSYYSTDAIGAYIWELLDAGHALPEIEAALRAHCAADGGVVAQALAAFVADLCRHELIAPDESTGNRPTPVSVAPPALRTFTPPIMQAHDDMKDMLLLDPVHDVQAAGWPAPKADANP